MQVGNYRFGPYELRSRGRELYKHGTKVKLRPQPFQVLEALLERSGEVLTRDELRELLWPKETFVDFEHGLNAAISELRGVLNDTASDPRYIETLPKVGYRVKVSIEPIQTLEPSGAAKQPAAATAVINPAGFPTQVPAFASPSPKGRARPLARRWLAVAASLTGLLAIAYFASRARSHDVGHTKITSLAVLPLKSLSADPTQEYLADGMTEALIGRLSTIRNLRVISR